MASYDFKKCLSPIDFELLCKDLLEADLGIQLENFSEGRDKGIDLRYAPISGEGKHVFNLATFGTSSKPPELIVQCKRYSSFANLKSELKKHELAKIKRLNPARYILTTSLSLSPQQVEEVKALLDPFIQSTGDIYSTERLNSILIKYPEIERRHVKLWVVSAGVIDSIINAGTHIISREEVDRTVKAAKLYVRNESFDEALAILKKHHVCIISGLPGIGKTTLARMLLLYFFGKKFDVVKIAGDIAEARTVGYHNSPRFYYYDDFLGQTAQADKLNKNEDQRLLDFMASVRDSKDSVFVLTTREYILNQAKVNYEKLAREKFDHQTCVIDLSKYSRRIRSQILYNHLYFSELPRGHIEALVAKRGYLNIVDHKNYNPRLIEYLTDLAWVGEVLSADYLKLFLRKLDNPVEIWGHAYRNQISPKARHLLLVLTTMPRESRMGDVALAFGSFHNAQCVKSGITRSAADFHGALKELDGTFVATRKVQDTILVRFQNPSIRDFMQYLLLSGELLEDLMSCLSFFEQANWLLDMLDDDQPQVPQDELKKHCNQIIELAQKLIDSASCSVFVFKTEQNEYLHHNDIDLYARVATVAWAYRDNGLTRDEEWMAVHLRLLAQKLQMGIISIYAIIDSVEGLHELGLMDSIAGRELTVVLKECVLEKFSDLQDFELLGKITTILPKAFSVDDLKGARAEYSGFIEDYAARYDSRNPEEIRAQAARIEEISSMLQVNTDAVQGVLKESANKIEAEQESRWDDDDNERETEKVNPVEFPDVELDSMFGTLSE